jgi:hypothetical protein
MLKQSTNIIGMLNKPTYFNHLSYREQNSIKIKICCSTVLYNNKLKVYSFTIYTFITFLYLIVQILSWQ